MESTKELITLLKQIRQEKNLSFDKILAMMEENGDFLSKSTLSRVFQEGSEDNGSFRYETLKPIADVLLDVEHIETDDTTDTKAYKSMLKIKKEIIEELKAANEQVKIDYADKLQEETEKFQKSLEFIKHQVELKDQRIDDLLTMNKDLMQTNNRLINQLMECPLRKE